ncbi:hypothetical protein L596_017573 [Steinernema carpocapsae]|uniref:Uncharacterized protein n=1 Tax=Steinernema carpocapsae TaxID=34508 RepID=A0A4U5N2D2_STECR|nr:hypothetical protein L596_017573 [Steinernema carpocapsae]
MILFLTFENPSRFSQSSLTLSPRNVFITIGGSDFRCSDARDRKVYKSPSTIRISNVAAAQAKAVITIATKRRSADIRYLTHFAIIWQVMMTVLTCVGS